MSKTVSGSGKTNVISSNYTIPKLPMKKKTGKFASGDFVDWNRDPTKAREVSRRENVFGKGPFKVIRTTKVTSNPSNPQFFYRLDANGAEFGSVPENILVAASTGFTWTKSVIPFKVGDKVVPNIRSKRYSIMKSAVGDGPFTVSKIDSNFFLGMRIELEGLTSKYKPEDFTIFSTEEREKPPTKVFKTYLRIRNSLTDKEAAALCNFIEILENGSPKKESQNLFTYSLKKGETYDIVEVPCPITDFTAVKGQNRRHFRGDWYVIRNRCAGNSIVGMPVKWIDKNDYQIIEVDEEKPDISQTVQLNKKLHYCVRCNSRTQLRDLLHSKILFCQCVDEE